MLEPIPPATPRPIASGNDMLFCDAMYPANGNTAIVGIGGKTVSITAAAKTPAYK